MAGTVKLFTGTHDEFKDKLKEAGDKLVVVDFYADWCGPCKMIGPKIVTMAQEFKDVVDFYKVNVDEAEEVASAEGISAMPTFKLYKNGIKVEEIVGANEEKIKDAVAKHK